MKQAEATNGDQHSTVPIPSEVLPELRRLWQRVKARRADRAFAPKRGKEKATRPE